MPSIGDCYFDKVIAVICIIYMYLIFVSTRIFYRKVLSKTDLIVVTVNWQKGKN